MLNCCECISLAVEEKWLQMPGHFEKVSIRNNLHETFLARDLRVPQPRTEPMIPKMMWLKRGRRDPPQGSTSLAPQIRITGPNEKSRKPGRGSARNSKESNLPALSTN